MEPGRHCTPSWSWRRASRPAGRPRRPLASSTARACGPPKPAAPEGEPALRPAQRDRGDAGKKINGRKRHILVDTLGLLLVVVIHTANIQDRDGLALVCRRLRRRFPWLRLIFADGGYQGETAACAAAQERLRLQIVKREPGTRGFAVLPKRWLVERTFAWLGRNRRLAKDFEATLASAATMVHLASIQLLARRLARA